MVTLYITFGLVSFKCIHCLLSGDAAQVWCRDPSYHHVLLGSAALHDCVEVSCPLIKCGEAHGGVAFAAGNGREAGID